MALLRAGLHHIRLQPPSHAVAASTTYGCRPYNASEWPECGPELARLRNELVGCQQGRTPMVSALSFEMRRALMVASTSSDSPLASLLYDPLVREEECRGVLGGRAVVDGRCDLQCA